MPTLAKFAPPLTKQYIEAGQPNPLRWELYRLEDELLIPQTAQFKCKDYFNEVVAWYHGRRFAVYGFDTMTMNFNDYGVFVRLYNVKTGFLENVQKLVQPLLPEGVGPLQFVQLENPEEFLTLFPRALFNSTYTISKLTKMLRICNVPKVLDSFEKLAVQAVESLGQPYFGDGHLVPHTPFNSYWWYSGDRYNSNGKDAGSSVIHNNGYQAFGHGSLGKA